MKFGRSSYRLKTLVFLLIFLQFSQSAFAVSQNHHNEEETASCSDQAPSDLQHFQEIGSRITEQMSRDQQLVLIGILSRIEEIVRKKNPDSTDESQLKEFTEEMEKLTSLASQVLSETQGEDLTAVQEIPHSTDYTKFDTEEDPALTRRSYLKKGITGACLSGLTLVCSAGNCILKNEWTKASLLSISAGLSYSLSGLFGPLVPLSNNLNYFTQLIVRAMIGATLSIPGNLMSLASFEITQQPNSNVSLFAMRSLMSFVGTLSGTCGNLIFYNKPANWTVWVGIVAMASVAALQMWYGVTQSYRSR